MRLIFQEITAASEKMGTHRRLSAIDGKKINAMYGCGWVRKLYGRLKWILNKYLLYFFITNMVYHKNFI